MDVTEQIWQFFRTNRDAMDIIFLAGLGLFFVTGGCCMYWWRYDSWYFTRQLQAIGSDSIDLSRPAAWRRFVALCIVTLGLILAILVVAFVLLGVVLVAGHLGNQIGSLKFKHTTLPFGLAILFAAASLFCLISCWSEVRPRSLQ